MKKILNDKFFSKVIKTFFEGFIASLVVTLPTVTSLSDIDILKNILVGAIAMGISAVLNLIQEIINGKGNIKYR